MGDVRTHAIPSYYSSKKKTIVITQRNAEMERGGERVASADHHNRRERWIIGRRAFFQFSVDRESMQTCTVCVPGVVSVKLRMASSLADSYALTSRGGAF